MGEKFWKTSISKVESNKIIVRGYNLVDLIGELSFGDVIYLLFQGELPEKNQGKMIEAILIAGCEHSLAAPSVNAARFVASSGVALQASVAAGISAIGDWHGGAIEQCARVLQQAFAEENEDDIDGLAQRIVRESRATKKRIPGYGHPYHTKDPRVEKLFDICEGFGLSGKHVALAREIGRELLKVTNGKVAMNIDGAMAAVISDMGFDWRLGKGFFIIARSAGLVAHVHEQMTKEKPFKAVPLDEIDYTGPEVKSL